MEKKKKKKTSEQSAATRESQEKKNNKGISRGDSETNNSILKNYYLKSINEFMFTIHNDKLLTFIKPNS